MGNWGMMYTKWFRLLLSRDSCPILNYLSVLVRMSSQKGIRCKGWEYMKQECLSHKVCISGYFGDTLGVENGGW